RALGKRVEDSVASLGRWPHDIEDAAHRDATPLGDAGPSLDAEMFRNLLLFRHRLEFGIGELSRILDQTIDAQPVVCKAALLERLEIVGHWQRAVGPVMR